MPARDEICQKLLTSSKARCVFLVDYCERELVALGDMSLEDAQRLVASMPSESDEDSQTTAYIDAPRYALRQGFRSGGYVLVLFDGVEGLALVTGFSIVFQAARSLARFAAPPERSSSEDSSSGAPARVAAWRR